MVSRVFVKLPYLVGVELDCVRGGCDSRSVDRNNDWYRLIRKKGGAADKNEAAGEEVAILAFSIGTSLLLRNFSIAVECLKLQEVSALSK